MSKRVLLALIPLTFSLVHGSQAATYTTFSVPGSVGTGVADINRGSTVAGDFWAADGIGHGYVRTASGAITTFDAPGSAGGTFNKAINVYGAIAGDYQDANETQHGFLRAANGSIETFDAPGAGTGSNRGTYVWSINPSNTVVGYFFSNDGTNNTHGYLRNSDGSFVPIEIAGAISVIPLALNNVGVVTGSYEDAQNSIHGFLWTATGSPTMFDVPGSNNYTYPSAVNGSGTIAGVTNIGIQLKGFVRDAAGQFMIFDVPGSALLTVSGINESGEVSGYAIGANYNLSWGFVRSASGTLAEFTVSKQITEVGSLNNQGIVAGTAGSYPGSAVGFLRQP